MTTATLAAPTGVLVTKLQPPAARDHTVERQRLLDLLQPQPGVKLIVLAAAAGYGKSTLLGTWHDREASRRSVAWVTIDERDNDPVVLWSHVVEAFTRACAGVGDSASSVLLGGGPVQEVVLPQLVNDLADEEDVTLILDDFHRLSNPAARADVKWLIAHAPAGVRLVVASRSEPALGLGAMRARGELLEVRADDLAFTPDEAESLLNDYLDLGVDHADVGDLVRRTEGWPAGLYLAALSLGGTRDRHDFVGRFGGTSRPVVDFLVDEVLSACDPQLQTVMIRCSVVERLSGPLCDAVLDDDGATEALRSLSRTNLFLLPLDDEDEWYRFHRVFAQLLRVELEHREPGLAPTLHRRASAWYREHGLFDEAIEHAIEAGAFDVAHELIAATWVRYANLRGYERILGWLQRFPKELKRQNAHLLTLEAWALSLCGRGEALDLIAAAEAANVEDDGPLPDGFGSIAGSLATLRGALPWGDVGDGLANALRALELEGRQSDFWPTICWALAIGEYFTGRPADAERWFEEAVDAAPSAEQWIVMASALGYRSLIAGEQGRLHEQSLLAQEAAQLARERGLESISGEVHLACGICALAQGEPAEAPGLIERGVETLRSFGQPTGTAFALVQQARVLQALGNRDGAAAATTEARAVIDACPDPGILRQWVSELEAGTHRRRTAPTHELSERERTVLRALTGPLSERDIGRELYLSHNTVHSHTRSIYRKLGASSRGEAIERARALGFL